MSRRDQLQDTLWPSEPRTLLKHQVYRHYLQCWMGKILQRFPDGSLVDGFAGPGEYLDHKDGSPIVVAKTLLEHSSKAAFGHFHLVTNEERPDRVAHLARLLQALPQHRALRTYTPQVGRFDANVDTLERQARVTPRTPIVWVLDPFDIKSLPFDLVARCLRGGYDEVLVTFFADEIYRFCEQPHMAATLTAHYGDESWRQALSVSGERARKEQLIELYCARLQTLPEVRARPFSISSKNATARYSIVFATHSDHGLVCWNSGTWRLDRFSGESINEFTGDQDDLFSDHPDLGRLAALFRSFAGKTRTFHQLVEDAVRLGYTTTHVRRVLDELRDDGLALREQPLESRTPWPESSVVRFYADPASSA